MTVPGNIDALLLGGQRGYQIERSLRFNSADSAYLNRTPASTTETTAWTYSAWVKRGAAGNKTFFGAFYGFNGRYFLLGFSSSDQLQAYGGNYSVNINPGVNVELATTAVYRDFSAWMHVVFTYDSANATASDRARFYINGSRITAFATATYPGLSSSTYINYSTTPHYIGDPNNGAYFDGYLTEVNFVSGQALTPSSFGETDTITGVWKPKKYAGTYGTNGFYLKFADNSGTTSTTLGKDSSGNGNNWTPNNFSVTAGVGNDSMIDTPTPYADGGNGRGNYATLSPLSKGDDATLSNGNLDVSYGSAPYPSCTMATFGMSSGKWYWETTVTVGSVNGVFGITNTSNSTYSNVPQYPGYAANGWGYYAANGNKYNNATATAYGSGVALNDVIGCAFDANTGKIWWSKNGTWQASGDPAAGTNAAFSGLPAATYFPAAGDGGGTSTYTASYNFGQRSFSYTPPSGFLALNTQNLPEPSIKKPSSYMDVKLWTGTGASNTISGFGFSPDLVWIKRRSGTAISHALLDTVRGANKVIYSNLTAAEDTYTDNLTAFNSDGFTLGTDNSWGGVNASTHTYVAWCWDESATPGFDIVTWTGDGAASRNISHGLGVAPKMIISKTRTIAGGDAGYWDVYHASLAAQNTLFLHTTGAATSAPTVWPSAPTSTVFTVGNGSGVNVSGSTYVAYLWSEVAGFSKFGSYTGNGSTDGPFVFCGFRPRWVMVKRTDTGGYDWEMYDSARADSNVIGNRLWANLSSAETSATRIDFLSNGFKIRDSGGQVNGGTIVFAAFAESPAKYSLAR